MTNPLRILDDLRDCSDDPRERELAADNLIHTCGYAAAGMAAVPVPLTETVGVLAIHVAMVVGLGRIYGRELSEESARELVARIGGTAGVSYVGSRLAMGAAKLIVPVVPGLIMAPLAFASTLAIGSVVQTTLESDGELSDDEIRELYQREKKKARGQFDPSKVHTRQPSEDDPEA